MTETLFSDKKPVDEVNPYGGEIKLTDHGAGKWTKRLYDRLGREAYLISSSGYWSRHEYEEVGQTGTIVSYYNSKGNWYKHLINRKGQVVWYERDDGMWNVITDTSHRVYFNRDSGLYLMGKNTWTASKLLAYLRQRNIKTCPTVVWAVRLNEFSHCIKKWWAGMFKDEETFWGCR